MNSGQIHNCCSIKCISWTAIFVGAIVGLGLEFLLNLFGVAIGLSAYAADPQGAVVFSLGGYLGIAIASIVAMFVAGWTAGYLAHPYCPKRNSGSLYGFTTWSLSLILLILMAKHLGEYVTIASNTITNHVGLLTNNPAPSTTPETAAEASKVAFTLFSLFFLGALAACFGGHCGMVCRPENCSTNNTPAQRM